LGAFPHPQEAAGQRLANEKDHQIVKKSKVKCFFSAPTLSFCCQNAPKTALICCQYVFYEGAKGKIGVDGESLTKVYETTLFRAKNVVPRRGVKRADAAKNNATNVIVFMPITT